MKRVIAVIVALLAVGGLAFAMLLAHGFSARDQPSALEAFVARHVRRLAIPSDARDAENPLEATPENLVAARAHFADHCASCHANDGSGRTPIGENLYPKAPDMREPSTQSLSDGELFYIIRNGIRFTGMPAWGPENPAEDRDSWTLVHFIRHLPNLSAEELKAMKTLNPKSRDEIEEEEQTEKFLRGEDSESTPRHH